MKRMHPGKKLRSGSLRSDGRVYIPYRVCDTHHESCTVMYDDDGNVEIHPEAEGGVLVAHSHSGCPGWTVNIGPILREFDISGYKNLSMKEENGIVKFNILQ